MPDREPHTCARPPMPHPPQCRQLAEEKKESEDRKRNMLPKERDIEREQKEAAVKAREREKEGNIMQCNQGKWDFDFNEEALPGAISLRVSLPRWE